MIFDAKPLQVFRVFVDCQPYLPYVPARRGAPDHPADRRDLVEPEHRAPAHHSLGDPVDAFEVALHQGNEQRLCFVAAVDEKLGDEIREIERQYDPDRGGATVL